MADPKKLAHFRKALAAAYRSSDLACARAWSAHAKARELEAAVADLGTNATAEPLRLAMLTLVTEARSRASQLEMKSYGVREALTELLDLVGAKEEA